ncbi:rhomboid family intramembrane serine protease [Mucilaginibacter celer]|uniref:Rhomboid family intramembrane serine protease n=1 Tax=Mucilaginibacter celer TaxID=2305508 RepID=A0A494VWY0_9SPHI|nr:rhomboid family intramembrane serine protease [Mucilaginibacter celer]AYL98899.1 rhomboid family intramembrane serine protease [Mucilaginibacter celer]
MNTFFTKLKLVFIPSVVIAVLAICIYTFFNWLIFVKLELFAIKDLYIQFVGPGILAFIVVWLWINPKFKLLNIQSTGRRDPASFTFAMAVLTLLAPCVIAQIYMEKATGKLTVLRHVSDLNKLPLTKFYEIKHFHADKRFVRFKTAFDVSGKYNDKFNMNIYAVSPVLDTVETAPGFDSSLSDYKIDGKKPLIILNGKWIAAEEVSRINPASIATVSVLKGDAAAALYGDGARNGVILINQKKQYTADSDSGSVAGPPPLASDAVMHPVAWIGTRYSETISNNLSPAEKEARYKAFASESQRDFDTEDLGAFVYLERLGASDLKSGYVAAVQTKDSLSKTEPVILSPVNEPFKTRTGHEFPWIFGSFGIGCCILLIIVAYWPLKETSGVKAKTKAKDNEGLKWLKQVLVPHKGFFATAIIIDLNLLVFIIMVFSGLGFISFGADDLLKWGGNLRPATLNGQYWRFLTNIFLHGGLMHILFNMYGLLFVGIFLEPLLGTRRYTIIYLLTGILASIASIAWHPATVSVGASGAIFGMYGVFLALLTTNLFPPDFKKPFLINTAIFVGYNLLMGLAGGIDNAAHIGGLVSGLLCGYALYPSLKKEVDKREAETETAEMLGNILGDDGKQD